MADALVRDIRLTPPLSGVQEGLDESLPDALYAPTYAKDLLNIRVAGGKWTTRRAVDLWQTLPGTGRTRWLFNFYTSTSQRIRLAAQGNGAGAALYELLEGTDTTFNSTTGGTSLGGLTEPHFQGVALNDAVYFTDRAGALRKYQQAPSAGNQVRSVALPTRPSAMPGVKARTYETLEAWAGNGGAAPYGWTVANSAKFDIEDGSGTLTSPLGGPTILLNTKTNPNNSPISENVTSESIPSTTIAFWVWNSNLPSQVVFQFGLVTATDYSVSLDMPVKESWLPLFVGADVGSINFKRFNVTENSGAADCYISKLMLPGRLQGSYRWVYTHYDPSLKRESEPSDIGNSGAPLDLSAIGTTGEASTAAAFQKSAAITFTSDSGSDTTTTKIRIYRSGGVPSLTQKDGIDVWYRVGEVYDQSTTVSGAHSAGATTLVVASATNIAVGDWLVIEKGTVSKEEYVRVTAVAGTSLTISQGLAYAHSNGVAVQIAFVDNIPNSQVDTSTRIDLERDDPPTGTKWVARDPAGRLWLFGPNTHVYVSNRATPDRPTDYEVFPQGIDPITRRSPLQGWDFELGGDVNDEEITWGGFYNDRPFAFTRRFLYAITATSQDEWGSYAVIKALNTGCVNGDTVAEVDGWLYWVGESSRIYRWNGSGPPEDISHQKVNVRLKAAPPEFWKHWFAASHKEEEGSYYTLVFYPENDLPVTTLTATSNGTGEIDLEWTDVTMDEDFYLIERSLDGETGWTVVTTVAADTTTYADTGLEQDTEYFYRVSAGAGPYP